MKALFIGGTGTISTAVAALAMEKGWEVTLLNRGSKPVPEGMESMVADIHDEAAVARIMAGRTYDVVAQFIAYGAEGCVFYTTVAGGEGGGGGMGGGGALKKKNRWAT